MDDLFLLSVAQMRGIEPYFPLSHEVARVDDQRAVSRIIFVTSIVVTSTWRRRKAKSSVHRPCFGVMRMPF